MNGIPWQNDHYTLRDIQIIPTRLVSIFFCCLLASNAILAAVLTFLPTPLSAYHNDTSIWVNGSQTNAWCILQTVFFHLITLGSKSICTFFGILSLLDVYWEKIKEGLYLTILLCCPQSNVRDSLILAGSTFLGWSSKEFQGSKFLGGPNLMFYPPWETGSSFLHKVHPSSHYQNWL